MIPLAPCLPNSGGRTLSFREHSAVSTQHSAPRRPLTWRSPGIAGSHLTRHAVVVALTIQLLLLVPASTYAQGQKDAPALGDSNLSEHIASRLLDQIAEGLNGRSARKTLNAFDLSRMNGGASFRDQVTAFINQTDTIRIHFKLIEVTENTAVVDIEMDAAFTSDLAAPQHKHMQLRFAAENGRNGWKFTDVQPRAFFSASA